MKSLFVLFTSLFLIIFVTSDIIQKYDPCGYVGSSTDPDLPNICLTTSSDCCYVTWQFVGYMYYSCVSKYKLVTGYKVKNISAGFVNYISSTETYNNVSRVVYSQCNNTEGVITSPSWTIPENPYVTRNLLVRELSYDDMDNYSGENAMTYWDNMKLVLSKFLEFLL